MAEATARPRETELDQDAAPAPQDVVQNVGVLTLLRLRDQLKQKLTEYSAALRASQTDFPDHAVEEIQSTIEDVQSDIEEAEVSLRNKTLALQRIQFTAALRNKVNEDDEDSRLILETVKRIMLLSRTIIKYKQQAREKEQQLADIKRKRLSLRKEEEQKLQRIQTMKKKIKEEQECENPVEAKMLSNLEKEREIITVIQNVFQNIIIGSRVNWAEDPALKEIVLQLEKDVQLQ